MAFVHGRSSRLLLDDISLSGHLRGWEVSNEIEMADATVEGDSGHKFLPGLINGSLSLDGIWQSGTGNADVTLNTRLAQSTASVITAAPNGFAVGERVLLTEARETNYAAASPVGDLVSFTASWQSEGQTDAGVSLNDTATAVTSGGAATSVDNAASSADGGVAHLHITAVSGTTPSATFKVQHSTDNSAWVDLINFGATTTTTQIRSTVAGTVNRYLRAAYTSVSGTTPSFTIAVAFARR